MLIKSKITESSAIAMIVESNNSCVTNVTSFTTSGQCGEGKVQRAEYVCLEPGKTGYEDCIDPFVAFEHAKSYCGQTCTPISTERPRQSCIPSPSCSPGRPCPVDDITQGTVICEPGPLATPTPTIRPRPTNPTSPSSAGLQCLSSCMKGKKFTPNFINFCYKQCR